jgi:DNA-binding XRE family transcriptional regulator
LRRRAEWAEDTTVKYYTHEEVLAQYYSAPEDEARLAAYRAEALAEIWGYQLAEVRRRQGLTQSDLAERLHITQTAVSKIERGGWLGLS